VLGKVDEDTKRAELARADVLCAPSLGGESFGMVLTEAFAAGTPVVASDIAGYRDVVTDDQEGRLVPPGDATALAATLRDLWDEPGHRAALRAGAAAAAPRFAWPRVAREVEGAYQEAVELAARPATTTAQRVGRRLGALPADGRPKVRPRRLPSLERGPGRRRPVLAALRRAGLLLSLALAAGLAYLALERVGAADVAKALLGSSPGLVVLALGLMCASMGARAVSWYAILRAALPRARVRLFDALQGTSIGVLMSATLPARLGEPSRALIVARRTGRPRDHLPIVLGTMVSQTLLNLVALVGLGAAMFSSVQIFHGHENGLILATAIPVVLLAGVLLAPIVLGGAAGRSRRLHEAMTRLRGTLGRVRSGLQVFRRPKLGSVAVVGQLGAWAIQWASCWALLAALGLDDRVGPAAAAAVLFAVNVTAVIPATPSNLGIFQAACVAVLHGGYHVSTADALGYGIVLQAVEIATAVIMGGPALVKEGLSWRDVRLRAMHAAPVTLPARSARAASEAEA
jgi:phosphatidylinositol alpha-mannosyltransferase